MYKIEVVPSASKPLANGEHPLMPGLTEAETSAFVLHLSSALYQDADKSRPHHSPDRGETVSLTERKLKEYEKQIFDFKAGRQEFIQVRTTSRPAVRRTEDESPSEYIEYPENRIGLPSTVPQ